MLALLLCLISLTRSTFGYFSRKVVGSMERGSSSSRRENSENSDDDVFHAKYNDEQDGGQEHEVLDDDASPPRSPPLNKPRRKANSVVDSMGISFDDSSSSEHCTPRRTRSQPTDETSRDEDQDHSIAPDPPGWRRKVDMVDSHVGTAVRDDYQTASGKPPVAKMPVERDDPCYNMKHKYRGKCVVFNHENFETGSLKRAGTAADAERIQKTFKTLGFDVDVYEDYTHKEVQEKITELSTADHSDNDCICIFVLTHGLSNDLISAKDAFYNSDGVWKPFTADNCTTLAGKPKLFFFQACRGKQYDGGVQLARFDRSETDSCASSYKLPTHADFLIAHSTMPGFYSWRDPEDGTWYVQCLCDILDEYWRTTDLLSMLTITARKVATEYASYHDLDPAQHDQKQVPSVTSMLIRDVYFTPKKRQRDEQREREEEGM